MKLGTDPSVVEGLSLELLLGPKLGTVLSTKLGLTLGAADG